VAGRPDEDGLVIPSPAECMRPIIEAALEAFLSDAVELHHRDAYLGGTCSSCLILTRTRCPGPAVTAVALGVES
jgi:hypothetical protein